MPVPRLEPGFLALHSNHAERLASTLAAWLARSPLPPLETEYVLVQSNGMAEWIKIELAQTAGVCAATEVMLPSRFVWRLYRQILGDQAVPSQSALDKLPLTWRLMALFQQGLTAPDAAVLAHYLQGPGEDRAWQLASRLADLYDQYQVYRPDWLEDWAQGRWACRSPMGVVPLPDDQRWQAWLWQQVLASLGPGAAAHSRAQLHQRAVHALMHDEVDPQRLPQRVSLFGMSHLPASLLQLMHALSRHAQVLMAVPNPCRYHWADVMDGRQWWQGVRARQPEKGLPLANVPLQDMHWHAPTLLAAWGKQGRDFVRMLDAYTLSAQASGWGDLPTMDVFEDAPIVADTPLLLQLQRRIRDLEPSHGGAPAAPLPADDRSLTLVSTYSPVRELEVLHDQLLQWLGPARAPGAQNLQPRDVVVMVPDVHSMAAAIDAVFGQYAPTDPRHIPYTIADLGAQARNPMMEAVQWLWQLPQQRASLSQLQSMLEVPAVQNRIGLDEQDGPVLLAWMEGTGIRWGLSGQHRADLGLSACEDAHTVLWGLQRLLWGYACGADPVPVDGGSQPDPEVSGLQAHVLGALAQWVDGVLDWYARTRQNATPQVWTEAFRQTLQACMAPTNEHERVTLLAIEQALDQTLLASEQAPLQQPVPLSLMVAAWGQALQVPHLSQRFRGEGVTFCTLMPMRAVPFRRVCLLGMNEGDYPRPVLRNAFDLMAQAGMGRPGDRARHDDDRQLMLEALLSAREGLYISWCGHNLRDQTVQPPSVLVAQLCDEIDRIWGEGTSQRCTQHHPMQPFSVRYFGADPALRTHAHEWATWARPLPGVASQAPEVDTGLPADTATEPPQIDLRQLERFLRRPVATFLEDRLQIRWAAGPGDQANQEPFEVDGLMRHQLFQSVLSRLRTPHDARAAMHGIAQDVDRWQAQGWLPMGAVGRQQAAAFKAQLLAQIQAFERSLEGVQASPSSWPLHAAAQGVVLQDLINPVGRDLDTGQWLQVVLTPARLLRPKPGPIGPLATEKLLGHWLWSVAAQVSGHAVHCRIVGADAVVHAPPTSALEALPLLQRLLQAWVLGHQRPLPFSPQMALHWLAQPEPTEALKAMYEGPVHGTGRSWIEQDPALRRCFPTLTQALQGQGLAHWAEHLFAPLVQWAQACTWQPLTPSEDQASVRLVPNGGPA